MEKMIDEEIEIPTLSGRCDAVLFRPDGEKSWPGVVYLTDIGGIRPATREMRGGWRLKGTQS
jgi:carboxymethylenebutenolidase